MSKLFKLLSRSITSIASWPSLPKDPRGISYFFYLTLDKMIKVLNWPFSLSLDPICLEEYSSALKIYFKIDPNIN